MAISPFFNGIWVGTAVLTRRSFLKFIKAFSTKWISHTTLLRNLLSGSDRKLKLPEFEAHFLQRSTSLYGKWKKCMFGLFTVLFSQLLKVQRHPPILHKQTKNFHSMIFQNSNWQITNYEWQSYEIFSINLMRRIIEMSKQISKRRLRYYLWHVYLNTCEVGFCRLRKTQRESVDFDCKYACNTRNYFYINFETHFGDIWKTSIGLCYWDEKNKTKNKGPNQSFKI